MRSGAWLAAIVMGITAGSAVYAQSDVVVMRRVVAPPTKKLTGSTPAYYSWQTSPWNQTGTCGQQGTETRTVACVRTDGVAVADTLCTGNGSGPRPIESEAATVTQTCSYTWQPGDWNATPGTCGVTTITRDVGCVRSDGTVSGNSFCSATPRPATVATITDYSGCAFSWSASDWSAPSTLCGSASETRTVFCQRSDGKSVGDSACADAGTKPAASQSVDETSGCTAYWNVGSWGATAPACGASIQSRSVVCMSGAGDTLPESECLDVAGAKPATSRAANSMAACTYTWKPSDWIIPDGACGNVTETRTFSCVDSGGNAADASLCTQNKPSSTRTAHVMTGCSYSWITGDWGPPQPGCGATVETRSVTCTASDGEAVANGNCTDSRPSGSQGATDYSACTYAWTAGPWSDWSATCGNAAETRLVSCQRADGTTTDDASCTGAKPATTQSSYQTAGCGYTWQPSTWSVAPACGPTTETRYVTCVRSDGQSVDGSNCTSTIGASPATSDTTTDYSTCTYSWAVGAYSDPSSTCGAGTQTRTVACQRSNGDTVADDQCASVGAKPDTTQPTYQTTSCTYTWQSNDWGASTPACGQSTQTRTNYCQRSDGQTVSPANCTDPQPATSQKVNDYSTCSYSWSVGQWSSAGVCGASATQTRTVVCVRSNGDAVADSLCTSTGQGTKPATSQTVTDYSGCTYAWQQAVGQWSSTCSANATRTNTVTCIRSDKQTVDDSYCDPMKKPTTSDTQAVTSSCTYTGTYGNPTACTSNSPGSTAGTQSVSITQCTRSDGTIVANNQCTPQAQTQSCTVPNTSDRYSRETSYMRDPWAFYPSSTPQNQNVNSNPNASSLTYVVYQTQCWDSQTSAASSSSTCSNLSAGPNVYDLVSIPATFVPDLRSIYVSQADVQAVVPHAANGFAGTTLANFCSGNTTISIMVNGVRQNWPVYCGTPDSPGHYAREVYRLQDPATSSSFADTSAAPSANNPNGSSYSFYVSQTQCWDSAAGTTANTAKCQYLSSGANVYDLLSMPATYVPELHEVYVNQNDLTASIQHSASSQSVLGTTVANVCAGASVYVWPTSSSNQSWTMRCGTPDSSGHYARQANKIADPAISASASNNTYAANNTPTASTYSFYVSQTVCWDSGANATASSTKCQYLSSGPNIYDIATVSATYVKDLREVYVNQNDLAAIVPHTTVSSPVLGTSIANVCNGTQSVYIYPSGSSNQSWTLRCGTPDTADHYARQVQRISDSATSSNSTDTQAARTGNVPTSSTFSFYVVTTQCWDTQAGAAANSTKCQYLPTGASVYDVVSVPATYVSDLRTVYINQSDLNALAPNTTVTSWVLGTSVANVCNGTQSVYVYVGGSSQTWTLKCGAPDSPSRYQRLANYYGDPTVYYASGASVATRNVNDTGKTTLTTAVRSTLCWDTQTNASVSTNICQYLPTGSNQYDQVSFNATWNTSAKTVTIQTADLQAASPHYSGSYPCGTTYVVNNGTTGNYKVVCQ